jgi:hypothetical protein
MVLETSVFSPFNHLTRLVARENFITHNRSFIICTLQFIFLNRESLTEELGTILVGKSRGMREFGKIDLGLDEKTLLKGF